MDSILGLTLHSVAIGAGATAAMDIWTVVRKPLLGTPRPDYGLVGRWFAHMAQGRFRHARIKDARPVRAERAIGWAAHYAVGIAFAAILLFACGGEWAHDPTLAPALVVGIASVAAPFLLMQPAMGAGVASSRAPDPRAARLQSIATHTVFGMGLYGAAVLLNLVRS